MPGPRRRDQPRHQDSGGGSSMSKLTRDQMHRLDTILNRLVQAERFIKADDLAVAKRCPATTTLHYVRADGQALYEVNKEVGSDLCNLYTARQELEAFLADARKENDKAKGLAA